MHNYIGLATVSAVMTCVFLRPAIGEDFVRIPHDPNAGGYEAFPDVCRLSDGRLMAVFYAGHGHLSLPDDKWPNGGRVSYSVSNDEGFTWSVPRTLYDSPDDDRDPSIVQLKNGQVVCNFQRQGLGTKPGSWTVKGTWVISSNDLGKTWSAARQIYPHHGVTSPIRELSDGRLAMGLMTANGEGAVGTSDDQGKTWNPAVNIPTGGAAIDAETDVIELKNGNLYAAQRTTLDPMYISISTDRGNSWCTSKALAFPGHCPYLHRTPKGIVLLATRNYKAGITSLRYSLDECQTWSSEVVVDKVGGAYPSIVDLRDGSELIVYYEEGQGSSIRAKRFQVTNTGIKWLPVVSRRPNPTTQGRPRKQAPGEQTMHNYQNVFPGARTVTLPVKVEDLKHVRVYKTAKGPKWSCWTTTWLTREGHVRVGFVDMTGTPADPKPSYGYEYARADVLGKQGIKRCRRWCESRDGATTWQPIRELDASDPLAPHPNFHLLLKSRSLLGIGGVWHEWDFTKNAYVCYGHTMAWLSTDDSRSWSKGISLNDPNHTESFCCRPKQLSDGTIVVPAYGTLNRQGRRRGLKLNTDAWLWFSTDGGRSWSKPLVLARGQPNRSNDEPDIAELGNDDLLIILRHSNPKAKGAGVYLNCGQVIVGKTPAGWRVGPLKPTNLGFRGCPAVLRTRDGILICAGSGNQFNFSVDEGRTWSDTATILDPAVKRHNHYPALLELPDGRVLSVYHVGNHWPYPPPQDEWIHATSFRVRR